MRQYLCILPAGNVYILTPQIIWWTILLGWATASQLAGCAWKKTVGIRCSRKDSRWTYSKIAKMRPTNWPQGVEHRRNWTKSCGTKLGIDFALTVTRKFLPTQPSQYLTKTPSKKGKNITYATKSNAYGDSYLSSRKNTTSYRGLPKNLTRISSCYLNLGKRTFLLERLSLCPHIIEISFCKFRKIRIPLSCHCPQRLKSLQEDQQSQTENCPPLRQPHPLEPEHVAICNSTVVRLAKTVLSLLIIAWIMTNTHSLRNLVLVQMIRQAAEVGPTIKTTSFTTTYFCTPAIGEDHQVGGTSRL